MTDENSTPGASSQNNRGQYSKGSSGNQNGRPKGSRNKATILAEQLLDGEAEEITRKCIELAKIGDRTALKICINRILPTQKSRTINFALPEIKTAKDVVAAYGAIMEAVSEGQMTPDEASRITAILDAMRRATDSVDIDERLSKIEAKLETMA